MSSIWQMTAVGPGRQDLDLAEVRRACALLADPEQGFELRGLPSGRSVVRKGDDLDGLCRGAESLADDRSVYYALNPVRAGAARATKETVVRRRWLLIDVDPSRPDEFKDDSATDAEHAEAESVAVTVGAWLRSLGWPYPVKIDSGNGWHLLYRINLPADDASQKLLREFLYYAASKFDSAAVHIDKKVHNAGRVSKLPGCWSRKGRLLGERPYRPCRLVSVPDRLDVVQAVMIAAATGTAPAAQAPKPEPVIQSPPSPFRVRATDPAALAYAQAALQSEAGKVVTAIPGPKQGRNNALNKAAFSLGQLVAGGLLDRSEVENALRAAAAGCGLDRDGGGVREVEGTIRSGLEAGMKQPRTAPERNGTQTHQAPGGGKPKDGAKPAKAPAFYRLTDLLAMDLPEPQWAVPGLLSEGLSILAGKPKLGKSWMALNLALTIAAGGMALGSTRVVPGDVLYLSLEDRLRRVQDRARKVLRGIGCEASNRLTICTEFPRQDAGGLEYLDEWISSVERPTLVIIDVWAKFRPLYRQGSQYEQDYEAASTVKAVVDNRGVSLLALHHCKKAAAEDVVDEISGTLGLAGSADGVLILNRARSENEGRLFLSGRDVEEKELAVRFDPQAFTWTNLGDSKQRTRSKIRQAIVDAFRRSGSAAYWPSEMAEILELDKGTVKKEMWRMAEEGQLRRIGSKYGWPANEVATGGDDEAF